MQSIRTAVAVAVGIVVGCGGARWVAPPPLALAQVSTVTRWDYYCVDQDQGNFTNEAKAAGAKGWEMVGGLYGGHGPAWCFKRPLP